MRIALIFIDESYINRIKVWATKKKSTFCLQVAREDNPKTSEVLDRSYEVNVKMYNSRCWGT